MLAGKYMEGGVSHSILEVCEVEIREAVKELGTKLEDRSGEVELFRRTVAQRGLASTGDRRKWRTHVRRTHQGQNRMRCSRHK